MLPVAGKLALTRSQRKGGGLIRHLLMPRRHLDRSSTSDGVKRTKHNAIVVGVGDALAYFAAEASILRQ